MTGRPPKPDSDHIVIVGPSKTGTTGLYTSVKRGLQEAGVDAVTVFEPHNAAVLDNLFLLAPQRTVLTKTTMNQQADVLPDPLVFDRRIMTVRDPRDVLISALLFRPLTRRSLESADESAVDQFVAALERKEADPNSISLRELFRLAGTLGIGAPPFVGMQRWLTTQQRLLEKYAFHVVRYEQFVRGDLAELSNYLGFTVENVSDATSTVFGHISRSKSSGDFVNWFRPDDLAYFNDRFGDALTALGYEHDLDLAENPVIDPATSSEYIRSRYRERRANLRTVVASRTSAWTTAAVDSEAALESLVGVAENGDAISCLHLAELARTGRFDTLDEAAALRWARTSAQLGLRAGMDLTIDLLSKLDSSEPAVHRELRAWRAERRARFEADAAQVKRIAKLERHRARLEKELKEVRQSAGNRVGTELVKLARSPRHNGRAAVRELTVIWRGRTRKRG